MAYVPTPSHGAPVGVAKATAHIFLNAIGKVAVTVVLPKEQFQTPHCGYFPSANQCASDDPSVFDLISTVVRGESVEAFAIP